jgi:hypothetical protein
MVGCFPRHRDQIARRLDPCNWNHGTRGPGYPGAGTGTAAAAGRAIGSGRSSARNATALAEIARRFTFGLNCLEQDRNVEAQAGSAITCVVARRFYLQGGATGSKDLTPA